MRILIIEVSVILRENIALGLRKLGHVVDEAVDGEDGLWRAEAGAHDILVLDLGLPKMDGIDIEARIYDDRIVPALNLQAYDFLNSKNSSSDRLP